MRSLPNWQIIPHIFQETPIILYPHTKILRTPFPVKFLGNRRLYNFSLLLAAHCSGHFNRSFFVAIPCRGQMIRTPPELTRIPGSSVHWTPAGEGNCKKYSGTFSSISDAARFPKRGIRRLAFRLRYASLMFPRVLPNSKMPSFCPG